ncbi:MAG TPA: hypothetical protein VFS10_19935 [Pyrinomonadaceae bacterium]|nr:hypothetical protein [Pyrinomonadaceae bacterium]
MLPRKEEAGLERQTRQCPSCGAEARREAARFCATCGRRLEGDYFPTDAVRASYRYERRPVAAQAVEAGRRARVARTVVVRQRGEVMPSRNLNGASTTALAFVTYALVPYVGILFCPGALLMGGIGLVRAYRAPHVGGGRASALGVVLGVLLLCVHLLLWWILYKVPEWTRTAPF